MCVVAELTEAEKKAKKKAKKAASKAEEKKGAQPCQTRINTLIDTILQHKNNNNNKMRTKIKALKHLQKTMIPKDSNYLPRPMALKQQPNFYDLSRTC
jgi:hypothetical protein